MFKMFKELKGQNKKKKWFRLTVSMKRKENTLKIIKQCFGEGADSHLWIFAFLRGIRM
jgi:hypothetical protein